MKITTTLVTLSLITTLALSGCGSKATTAAKPEVTATKTAQSGADKSPSDAAVKEGTTDLLKTAKLLSTAATAGDEAKIKEYGPKLEEVWATIEDGIKPKYPEIYDQIEINLNPTVEGTKASQIDKDAILKLDNQLIQVLFDLSQKLIPIDQVKAGATQLISITNDLKKEIDAGNEAKIKEIGPKLEETWKTFEDGVKPRSADLYAKIEKSLNPEVAGSQKSPIDKQALGTLNENLTQTLTELVQNLK
jgi:iron uptake system EfeUOB component EfeO/EfeM